MGDGLGDLAFWLAVGFLMLGLTFGPIGRATARLIEALTTRFIGRGQSASEDLTALADRVQELEGVERRLLELEERLDFAERLLTSGARPVAGQDAETPPESAAVRA
jgi:hypothetical protein